MATYTFNNTLDAQQAGVAALTAVDPQGTSGFQDATVFGNLQTTYHFDGAASPPDQQGGLQLDTTGLIGGAGYSVEMVFELANGDDAWRRILDSQDRQSDAGFYVDPDNVLDVFPAGGSGSPFTSSTFFDVFLTVDASNNIAAYFSGVQQLSLNSDAMNLSSNFLNFFLDNTDGGGQGEWATGNISLIKVYDTALTADEVASETAYPSGTAPEPSTWFSMLGGAALLAVRKWRNGSRASTT